MKITPSLIRGLLAITSLLVLSSAVLAHEQGDLGSSAALVMHIISAPDHVVLLVIGLVAIVSGTRHKFSQRASAKIRQSTRREKS